VGADARVGAAIAVGIAAAVTATRLVAAVLALLPLLPPPPQATNANSVEDAHASRHPEIDPGTSACLEVSMGICFFT